MTTYTTRLPLMKKLGFKCLTKKQCDAREKRHADQQKKWGFCDADLWNLFCEITDFVLPRLIRYRKMPRMGYPVDLSTKRWDRILDQMIAAFRILAKDDIPNKKEVRIIERGLKLFAEWFRHLWD